ncbi:hypothetical protein GCM10010387_67390 [Streptomyces inusitatus]|uniref:Uncharacterized protein n=1 Tax=Streptomyces inusitatus TaxID=68221 RepID=A0A918QSH7_9ACTN|nr:hypothetical protein [Streptomyces inusitatus]GGZ64834.1 hypothetical protein GCM10010387_67390 [Streptomyces inusitatus]
MTTEKKPPVVRKPKTYAATLEELRKQRDAIKRAEAAKTNATARRDVLIAHAATFAEATGPTIAQSAGVVPARVSQIAPVRKSRAAAITSEADMASAPQVKAAVRTARRAGVIGSATEPAEAPAPKLTGAAGAVAERLAAVHGVKPTLPGADDYAADLLTATQRSPRDLPGIGDTPVTIEMGSASKRKWTPQRARVTAVAAPDGTMFLKGQETRLLVRGRSAGAWLQALPPEVERLVFVGAPVWHTDRDTTMTYDVNEWLSADLPEGWEHGRHFPHERHPVARYTWTGEGRRRNVELQHLGTWVPGVDESDPRVAWHAFRMLRDTIRARWGTDSVELLGSPTTLGQDLWARTIPQNTEYPIMSTELRELIQTTSGQGRFELFTPPTVPEKLPSVHYYDCTFAYAGLTWGLAVGNPSRVTAREYENAPKGAKEKWMRGRGRWHVRATVPADWAHVGLLPCSGHGGWEYPSTPGRTFTSWASGPEIWLALQKGWHVEVLDGITWAEGKPLNLWRDKLVESWHALTSMSQQTGPGYREAALLAAKMVRSILLFTIGSFHSKGGQRKGLAVTEDQIPASARRAEERGGAWVWESSKQQSGDYRHPEWSAEVYGRMRARLLAGPAGTGALSVAPSEVIAFRSDAMLLTRATGWANPESTPGRFRLKGSLGSVAAPLNEGELLALRDAAEAAR